MPTNSDNPEQLQEFTQAALPALQALARLYGPMQQKQPDTTTMYHCNGADLTVGDVRSAIQALGILIKEEPVVHANFEPPAPRKVKNGSRS